MLKRVLALLLSLALILSLAACGAKTEEAPATEAPVAEAPAAAEPKETEAKVYDKPELTLTFPEINAESSTACKLVLRFAENVKKGSNGRIEINVFGGGQLGTEAETMEMLRIGTADFIRINPANAATRGIDIPEYTALGLPYLIQSVQGGLEFLYSDSGKAIADRVLEASGGEIRSMYNYICTPARNMMTKDEVTSLADFAKQKIRSETSEIKIDMVNSWASATPLALSEIYTALSTGVLDGCEHTLSGLYDNAWYEQVKYVYETEHVINANLFLVGEKTWQKLTADEQTMMIDALKEACDWFQAETEVETAALRKTLEESGIKFNACTDKQDWIDACAPLYEKYAAGLEDYISEIQSYK